MDCCAETMIHTRDSKDRRFVTKNVTIQGLLLMMPKPFALSRWPRRYRGYLLPSGCWSRCKLTGDVCEFLVYKLLKYHLQDADGYTPLHLAAGYMQLESLQSLLDAGADADIEDGTGRSVCYHVSAACQFVMRCFSSHRVWCAPC